MCISLGEQCSRTFQNLSKGILHPEKATCNSPYGCESQEAAVCSPPRACPTLRVLRAKGGGSRQGASTSQFNSQVLRRPGCQFNVSSWCQMPSGQCDLP